MESTVVKVEMDRDVRSKRKEGKGGDGCVVAARDCFGGRYCAAAATDQAGSRWRYAGGPCEDCYRSEDYGGGSQARGAGAGDPVLFAQFAELYGCTEEMPL